AYYVNHDYESAAGAFRAVLKKWPDSRKAPDALLKLGYTQYAQKQYPAARATLTEGLRKYPGSDSAKHAAERLRRSSGAGSHCGHRGGGARAARRGHPDLALPGGRRGCR